MKHAKKCKTKSGIKHEHNKVLRYYVTPQTITFFT